MQTSHAPPPPRYKRTVSNAPPLNNHKPYLFATGRMCDLVGEDKGDSVGGSPQADLLIQKMAPVGTVDLLQQHKLPTPPAPTATPTVATATATATAASAASSQQIVANSSSSSTTTTSRVAKSSSSSSRLHHTVSSEVKSSSLKSDVSELKSSSIKSDLTELKSSISEMKNLSTMKFNRLKSSVEDLVEEGEPVVTFPDGESPPPGAGPPPPPCGGWDGEGSGAVGVAESSSLDHLQMKRIHGGDVAYQESVASSQRRARLDVDGISAQHSINKIHEGRSLKSGEVTQVESQNMTAATMCMQTESFTAQKKAMAAQQQRQTITSSGGMQEKHVTQSTQSNITITKKSSIVSSQIQSHLLNGGQLLGVAGMNEEEFLSQGFEDLHKFSADSSPQEVESVVHKYTNYLSGVMDAVRRGGSKSPNLLDKVNEMIRTAWSVPTHGHELGSSLCNALRTTGALDLLLTNCNAQEERLQFSSAKLLEQCLTTENRDHVVEHGLEKVVITACVCTKNPNSVDHSRVGTGILEHLFKHSEGTCSDVIRLGGLDAVLFECRKNDIETLRHCAGALANLSLYGGAENQEAMIKRKVPMWLFPLAFHNDDNIKYYACLAIAVLVANSEIEAAVLKSGTLDLVEPFVTSHNPSDFAKSNLAHAHGQSKHWLRRLVPVLSSKREEARNLAAFHFCMEAGIKKHQGNTEIFREIGAIEPLKKVASSPNAIASKYAAQALRLIGEEVPHKLSQQVPLWSVEDVREWVKQIGFSEYATEFECSRVDGDLLLQLTETNLANDLNITNGIRRKRFLRELQNLKKMADYSSRDVSNLNAFLLNIGPEFSIFTYSMLNAGVDKDLLRCLTEDQLVNECGITNSIQRQKILDTIKGVELSLGSSSEENLDKSLDVFVSYRRSNGSQLASLLKVHLQLRGFSVFIDVERLEAGKFDNNLLQSIRQARNFLLVLTPNALERCINDSDCKDWVHREIVAALQSQCNIIPITDSFQWPDAEELPDDMRAVCHFNGIRWIHDYQDACVDKLERFLRGEVNNVGGRGAGEGGGRGNLKGGDMTPGTPGGVARPPPSYQRLHSNLSSADGSDKD